jgi:hypothetical protein
MKMTVCGQLTIQLPLHWGLYSVVGIATRYGLDDPGIESRWRRDFPPRPDQVSFLRLSGLGIALTTHPHPAPRSKKE